VAGGEGVNSTFKEADDWGGDSAPFDPVRVAALAVLGLMAVGLILVPALLAIVSLGGSPAMPLSPAGGWVSILTEALDLVRQGGFVWAAGALALARVET
jgi:hypothetical protein